MRPIGQVLAEAMQGLGLERGLAASRVLREWEGIVGREVARHSVPDIARRGCLKVLVSDAVWMHQLSLLKPKILSAIASRIGPDVVRDLWFIVGPLPAQPGRGKPGTARRRRPSSEVQREVAGLLDGVGTPEWRDSLARLMAQALSGPER